MGEKKARITCSIFQKQEPIIEQLTDKINKAKEPEQKIGYAEELLKEVGVLLTCAGYEDDNLDCKNCHTIGNLRKATAELIIKTKKLL